MPASANTAALAPNPDPHQDQAAAGLPARAAGLRRVLGKLIAHGKRLAEDLTRRSSGMTVMWIAVRFGTKDIALILARITRGLRMAAALQATLPAQPKPARRVDPARPAPGVRKPRTRPAPVPRNNADSVLGTLPTSKEIAAQLRDRPVGEVLAEICRDLGILTADSFWQELEGVLLENGGDLDSVIQDADNRIALSDNILPPYMRLFAPTPPSASTVAATTSAAATGPP